MRRRADGDDTDGGSLTVRTEMEPLGEITITTHSRGEVVTGNSLRIFVTSVYWLKEMTKADIQKLALAPPEADQIELAHTLLDNTTPSLNRTQKMEVTRRIKAYRADPSILVSEEDALIRLKQLVAG